MKNYRNVRSDKSFYNNGKWDTVYTEDDIKRLAYYNVDLPHVVGIGTKRPFSKFSFGNSEGQGHHISGIITPGKVTAIAMHEKQIDKVLSDDANSATTLEGQDFTGFSYVEKLRSIRKTATNEDATGIGIFSNKSAVAEDTSLKTDKAVMYVTDDGFVSVGSAPTEFQLIDKQIPAVLPGNNDQDQTGNMITGPNIKLDVHGSMHVNGFINFLKNGPTNDQKNDNPAGQLTYDTNNFELAFVDPSEKGTIDNRACPEGAIWVGFDKKNDSLLTTPRLFIQRAGKNTRVLTEFDTDIFSANGGSGNDSDGFKWSGGTDSNGGGLNTFYVFKMPGDSTGNPSNTLINTYIGRPGVTSSAAQFDPNATTPNPLPSFKDGDLTSPPPSALSVVGNLSVFDFTTGGTNGSYLSGEGNQKLNDYKRILKSDIYTKDDPDNTNDTGQHELGTIYMDRHLMIGGFYGPPDVAATAPKFGVFTSAIDISGGITNKPIMRVLTGVEKGSLVTQGTNCQDSIIIGNIPVGNISGDNKKSLIFGDHSEIQDVNNTIVHGSSNSVYKLTNSLVVGNNLKAGDEAQGGTVIDGMVALGVGDTNLTIKDNDRIVFATKDGANAAVKALTIDKDGNVKISKNLEVEGDHVHLEVTELKIQDPTLELNVDGNGTAASLGNTDGDQGGIVIKDTSNTINEHKFLWYGSNGDAGEWRTYDAALSTGSGSAAGIFKSTGDNDVELKTGNSTTSSIKIENGNNGDIDMLLDGTGKMKIGGTTPTITTDGEKNLKLDTNSGTDSGSITITDGVNGDITVAPNGNGKIKVGGTTPTITTDGAKNLILDTADGTNSGSITINQGQNANIEIKPDGNGDVNLVTDMVKIGDTDEDVSIITNGEGVLKLETGGGNKDIEIKPNGSGKTIIYSDHVATTFNNDGTVNVPSSGARFSKNGSKVDLLISGKLTVDGLIDPTGLILDDGSGETLDATKCCITWDGKTGNSANLQVQFPDGSGGSTTKYIPFSGSANDDGSGSGGSGGSVEKANKVKVEDDGSSTTQLEVVFCDSQGSGNASYESLKSDRETLVYTPNSGTLKATIFEGRATKLNLSSAGLVEVDADGSISVNSSDYALNSAIPGSTSDLENDSGFITATDIGVKDVTKSNDDLTFTKADNSTVTFGRENIEDVLAGMLTSTASNNAHKNVTVSYTDSADSTQGILALEANGDLFLKSDGPRIIKVDEGSGGNDGAGNNLTLEAGAAKGNNGNDGYNGGDIELVPGTATSGTSGGTNGTAGNVVIKGSRTIATSGGELIIAPSNSTVTLQGNSTAPIITTGSSQDLKIQPTSGITEFGGGGSGDAARITSATGNDLKIQPAVNSNNSNLKVESTTGNCRLSLEASTTSTSGDYWTEIEMIAQNNQNNFITSNKTLKFIDEVGGANYNSYMDIEMNSTDHQNSKIKAYVPLQFSETKNGTITVEKRAVTDGTERGNPIIIRQGGVETSNIDPIRDLAGGNVIVYSGRTESKSGTSNQTQNDITSDCKFVIGSVDGLINNKTVEILDETKHTLTIKKAGNGFTAEAVYKLSIGEDVDGDEITDVDTLKGGYVEISVTIDDDGGTNTGFSDENTWQVAKKLVDAVNNNRYLQSIGFEAGFKSDGTADTDNTEVYFYSRRDGLTLEYKNGSSLGSNTWPVNNNGGAADAGWMEWTDSGGTATLKPTKHLKITPSDIDFEAQSNGNGNDFTIKTQSGVGNDGGTGNNDGYDGGDLILEPGTGSSANGGADGTNGSVVIKNGFKVSSIGGNLPTSGNNILVVDSNGIVTVDSISSASGTYGDSNVETLLQGNLSTAINNNDFNIKMTDRGNNQDAKKLIITAQGFDGSASHEGNGGDLQLSGGLGTTGKTNGVVDITSGLKISSLSSSGPLEVNSSGVVSVGSNLSNLHDADATDGFTIGMIDHNSDGQDLTIKAQNAGGNNNNGGNLILSGGNSTNDSGGNTTSSNGEVQVNSNLTMAGDNPTIASTTPSGSSAQPLRFKAANSNYTFMNGTGTNPIINTEASKDLSIQPGSSNIRLGPANTTTDFTIKMTDSTNSAHAKKLKIEGQKAATDDAYHGGNIEITAGEANASGSGTVNGGDVVISGGGHTGSGGTIYPGNVHIKNNPIFMTTKKTIYQNTGQNSSGDTHIPASDLIKGFVELIAGDAGSSSPPTDEQMNLILPTAANIKLAIGDRNLSVGSSFKFILRGEQLGTQHPNYPKSGMYLYRNTNTSLYPLQLNTTPSIPRLAGALPDDSANINFHMSEFLCRCTDTTTPKFDVYQLWKF